MKGEKRIWTYESLAQASNAELEHLTRTCQPPSYEQIEGYIYCGWIHTWVRVLTGEKFRKGFLRKGDKPWGFNERTQQDGKGFRGEWKPVIRKNGKPAQLAFYRYTLVKDEPVEPLFKNYMGAGLIDYHISINNTPRDLIFKVIRDFTVMPNENDPSLLLCKAYFQLFKWLNVWHSFFILGHREKIENAPW